APEQVDQQVPVAGVALIELGAPAQVHGFPLAVHRGRDRVEDHHLMSEGEQPVTGVGSDEPRTADNEDLHARRRSAASRYTSSGAAAVAPHVNCPARRRPRSRSRSRSGPAASTMARAIEAGSFGSASTAACPAVSGMALVSEVTTGQPHA